MQNIRQIYLWDPYLADRHTSALAYPLDAKQTHIDLHYIHDHYKNVVGLLDANGTITATYEYDSYGRITSQTGSVAGLNPYRYSSELHNPVTGMVDYLYRTYNPVWIHL